MLTFALVCDLSAQEYPLRLNSRYGYIRLEKPGGIYETSGFSILRFHTDANEGESTDTLVRVSSALEPVLCDSNAIAILSGSDSGSLLIVLDFDPEISRDTVAWFPGDSIAAWMQARPDPRAILCSHHYTSRFDVAAFQFDEAVIFVGGMSEGRARVLGHCTGVDMGNIQMSQDFSQYIVLSQARRIDGWGKTLYYGPVRISIFDCKSKELDIAYEYYGTKGVLPRRQSKDGPVYFLLPNLEPDAASHQSTLWKLEDKEISQVPDSSITPQIDSLFGNRLREMLRGR
jgi:hypothetical protein